MSWNGSTNVGGTTPAPKKPAKKSPKTSSPIRGLIAGIVVVALVVGVYFVFYPGSDNSKVTQEAKDRGRIKEVEPAVTSDYREKEERSRTAKPMKIVYADEASREAASFKERMEKRLLADPVIAAAMTNRPPRQARYRTTVEQMLNYIFNTPLGKPPPIPPIGIPPYEIAALDEILENPPIIMDEDDEEVILEAEQVIAAKKELKKYLSEGGEPEKFLEFYHHELEKCHNLYMTARGEIVKTIDSGDIDLARSMFDAFNEKLREEAIIPIQLSKEDMEEIGISSEEETK